MDWPAMSTGPTFRVECARAIKGNMDIFCVGDGKKIQLSSTRKVPQSHSEFVDRRCQQLPVWVNCHGTVAKLFQWSRMNKGSIVSPFTDAPYAEFAALTLDRSGQAGAGGIKP